MFQHKAWRTDSPHPRRTRLRVEELEARITPYVTTGNAWPHPQTITISFVPDGTTIMDNQYGQPIQSTLFHDFNSQWSQAAWQKQILLAAQWWADATNINFSLVGDDGVPIGTTTGTAEQGDPNLGDIRISGFKDTVGGELAAAYQPPPANNYSLGGDIYINTGSSFSLGTTYDLATVVAHEIGHALGMDHSGDPSAVMAPYYPGTRTALTADDAAGIESIYSGGNPRSYDVFGGYNNSFASAPWYSVSTTTQTALVSPADITKIGQSEYEAFIAPLNTSSTLKLSVQSQDLSLLEPTVTVYNAFGVQLAYQSGLGQYGTTLNLTVSNILPAFLYYVKVSGAESNALGTGYYGLSLSFGANPTPAVPLFYTYTPNGSLLHSGGSEADSADTYEATPATTSITAQPPAAPPASFGLLQLDAGHHTDDTSGWTVHSAQDATGPHAKAADPFAQGYAADDSGDAAIAQDFASWADAVPSLFPRRRAARLTDARSNAPPLAG